MRNVYPDYFYNPCPIRLSHPFQGKVHILEPMKITPFFASEDPRLQDWAAKKIERHLGKWGARRLDMEKLASGTQEERKEYLKDIETEGLNAFVQHVDMEYRERFDNDNVRLAGQNKESKRLPAISKKMLAIAEAVRDDIGKRGKSTPEAEVRQITTEFKHRPDIDYDELPVNELKSLAKARGLHQKRGWGRDELLASLQKHDEGVNPDDIGALLEQEDAAAKMEPDKDVDTSS
jgi:hypothetical protein